MPAAKKQRKYWDAGVFLAYFKNEVGRADILSQIIEKIVSEQREIIVTSIITLTEVAFIATEKTDLALLPDAEKTIDDLLFNPDIIELVELHSNIAVRARSIMREAFEKNIAKVGPMDAIHLATAEWANVHEIHTYDGKWFNYEKIVKHPISEPYIDNPRLL